MPSSTDAINKVLLHEGGYVNNPLDKGGATNFGITQKVYETFIGRPVTIAEMKAMPKGNAIAIYKKDYWDKVQGDKIKNYGVAFALFDQSVNRGHKKVISQAQSILKIPVNGIAEANFVTAINKYPSKDFLDKFITMSKQSYIDIVKNNPSQVTFLKGWLNRIASTETYSIKNLAKPVSIATVVVAVLIAGYFLTRKPSMNTSISKSKAIYG
jgi:lysozyme family protein